MCQSCLSVSFLPICLFLFSVICLTFPTQVRRVSFALPLAQESQDKESSEAALPEIPSVPQPDCKLEATTEPEIFTTTPSKGSDSTAYTVIKRVRVLMRNTRVYK